MAGKLPIDRVREARDAPKIYDEHRERFAEHEAAIRDERAAGPGPRPELESDVPGALTGWATGEDHDGRPGSAPDAANDDEDDEARTRA